MSKFVTTDIHGRFDALQDVLEQVSFDKEKDELIVVGDIVDGGEQTKECIEYLLTLKNLRLILGNHDDWLIRYYRGKHPGNIWIEQGGRATLRSYGYRFFQDPDTSKIPKEHIELLESAVYIYEDEDAIYVHAGLHTPDYKQTPAIYCLWDRNFIRNHFFAWKNKVQKPEHKLIITGHTCTQSYTGTNLPFITDTVIGLDTGAGHGSKLTLLELPSREYWQSRIPEFKLIRDK